MMSGFENIFWFFNLSLIARLPKCKSKHFVKNMFRILSFLFGVFVCIFHAYANYFFLVDNHFVPITIANTFMAFVTISLRLILSARMKNLKKLTKHVSNACAIFKSNRKMQWSTFFWIIGTIFVNLILTALTIDSNLKEYGIGVTSGFPRIYRSKIFDNLIVIFFSITLIFFLVLPVHTFSMYYSLICHQLKLIMNNFKNSMERNSVFDYNHAHNHLVKIIEEVELVNSTLQSLVFFCILFNGATMYFAVTYILHPETFGEYVYPCAIFILCLHSFASFILMTGSAISVNDTATEVLVKAKQLPFNNKENFMVQIRFHADIEKELSMKIWGLGSITRGFFIATLGTIFTYCILIDSISSMKNNDVEEVVKRLNNL